MISERKFAEKFTSFWRDALPRGSAVSRYINLQQVRFLAPLESNVEAKRRALANEFGFRLFVERIQNGRRAKEEPSQARISEISSEAARGVIAEAAFRQAVDPPFPTQSETEDAFSLADRLAEFFDNNQPEALLLPMPEFAGCGILESCRGDLLAGTTLYEVKSGEGNFRLADLRQVLVYCGLNQINPLYEIRSVCLVNPRMGVFFEANLEDLARSASGVPADTLFFEMTNFLTSQGTSS